MTPSTAVTGQDVLIVVPTLGQRPEHLAGCLDSLVAQTSRPRVVIVCGGDVDAARRVAAIRGVDVVAQRTSGLSAAINEAWERDGWRSDFTGWLGDDDLLAPHAVERCAQKLSATPAAVMAHGRCWVVDEQLRPKHLVRNGWMASRLVGWGRNLVAQPGCLFRTSAVRQVGGLDETLRLAMDVDLYIRLKQVGRIVSVPSVLGVFREHDTSLSTADTAAAEHEARASQLRSHRQVWGVSVADAALLRLCVATSAVTRRLPDRRGWPGTARRRSAALRPLTAALLDA